jgi:threonine dehydrogenase-like Zn-dependent dehydrogenase
MKSILVERPGRYEIVDLPQPDVGPGEVLVQLEAAALCNQHDVKVWTGGYQKLEYLEYGIAGFPGHEGVGIVVDAGDEVSSLSVGDRVVMSGLGGPPLYRELVVREAREVVPVARTVDPRSIAFAELMGCVHRGLRKCPDWQGTTVVVAGLGPAGLTAIQMLSALGAEEIVGIDINAGRLDLAGELGAHAVYDVSDPETYRKVAAHAPDRVYETTGNAGSYRQSVDMARDAVILFGYSEGEFCLDPYPIFDHELTLIGSKWLTVEDLKAVVHWVERGQLRTAPMVSAEYSFDQYEEAIRTVQSGEAIKVILTP